MADTDARVLVVDDERFFREAISEVLEGAGISCISVETGEAGLAAAEDTSLGAVVLDLHLPGMDGLEVLERLRECRPELRVLILSASADQELVLEALRLGACDYLGKPLHDEELVLAVRRALEGFAVSSDWRRLRSSLGRLVDAICTLSAEIAGLSGDERERRLHAGATEAAAEVLGARKTSLMRLDEDGQSLRVVAAVGRGLRPEDMDPALLGRGVAGAVIGGNEPVVVRDLNDDSRFSGYPGREFDADAGAYETNSFAAAPIRAGGRAIGVLCATDREDQRPFDGHDLALLRLLAHQVAELAVAPPVPDPEATVQLAESTAVFGPDPDPDQAAERDAELARRICDALVSEVEPERVLRAVLEPIPQILHASVSLYLLDGVTGLLEREAEIDAGGCLDRPQLSTDRGLTGLVAKSGQMIATARPELDARFDPEVDTPADGSVGPLLCVPLALRGKCIGVCRVFPAPEESGEDPSARTGEVLGAALSAAVRNVLLYRSLIESIEEVAEVRRQSQL